MTQTQNLLVIDGWSVSVDDEEIRARATDVAERLGYSAPRQVREIIERNRAEFERFGAIYMRRTIRRISKPNGGVEDRAIDEPWLNEGQALLLATLSRTEKASDVRTMLIQIFMKARRGELAPATPSAGLSLEAARELGRSIVEPILQRLTPRDARTAEFAAYQNRRRRLPGAQAVLGFDS